MSTADTTETDLAERLRQLRLSKESTQSSMAEQIEKSQQAWGRYEKGQSTPSVDVLQKIVDQFEVNPSWLLIGEGDMRLGEYRTEVDSESEMGERIRIPIYEDAAGAGTGEVPRDDIVAYGRFFKSWLRSETGIQPDRAFIAPVRGRSMETLLQDGDLVLCERAEEIQYEDIYVCRLNGELKVKHAHRANGTIVLKSENDRYPSIEVGQGDEFDVIGRVVRRVVR